MRTNIRSFVVLLMPLVVFAMAQVASAFYDPNLQRWVNRDPISENGGINLYAVVANDPVNRVDRDGRLWDTIWDVGNLIYDAWTGNWDDFAADAVAAAIPFVPAGASKVCKFAAKKAARAAPPVNVLPSSGNKFVVDPKGNVIPLKPGETLTGSPNGKWLQVRDANGNPTGMRLDGGHKPTTHPDPRAQVPHAHVPGGTNPDGTPWLPVNH